MNTTIRQAIYLVLSALGVGLTWWQNIAWMMDGDGGDKSFGAFWLDAFATHASASITLDVLVVTTVGLVLVFAESRRLGMHPWWPVVYLVLSSGIAVAFMFPLFLFFRERRMAALPSDVPRAT